MSKPTFIFGTEVELDNISSPYQLYRKMRPEYFSDSERVRKMSRDQFKYIMSTISSAMRQDAFEEFTRQCVAKLITPNVVPQSGPTGGGDAKADLITYPVSERVSSLWAVEGGGCTQGEMWAFAVSSVKNWGAKMDSDVKKIAEKYPECTRIYYCTNQTVSSRKRLEKQTKYKQELGIETFILDLNWYTQAVFDQGCYQIAIDSLGLGKELDEAVVIGPRDAERIKRLAEIDAGNPRNLSNGIYDQYVEELIEAAILTRELERSEQEIKARFALALSEAKKYGFSQQVYECLYQEGWTDFYWFENPDNTHAIYQELKKMLDDIVNVTRIEKLYNLYHILYTAGQAGLTSTFDINTERGFIEKLYNKLSKDPTRPSCTLYLKICLLEDDLMCLLGKNEVEADKSNVIIEELNEAMKTASNHLDINFESHAKILMELGRFIPDNAHYDELIDNITSILSTRAQDVSAAEMQCERGSQKLYDGDYVGAVKHLSRSVVLFHKESTTGQLIMASGLLAHAYSQMDLLYAAKIYYCHSLSLLTNKVIAEGTTNHLMVSLLFELCEIELRLGQLTSFLEWLKCLDLFVSGIPNYLDDRFLSDRQRLDAILGARLYDSQLDSDEYSMLPDILTRNQLDFSRNLLLYRMKQMDQLDECYKTAFNEQKELPKFINQLLENEKLLFPIIVNANKKAKLQTLVHGVSIIAKYTETAYAQTYAEMFLACCEMMLESPTIRTFPILPEIRFMINCTTSGESKITSDAVHGSYQVVINKNTFTAKEGSWNMLIEMVAKVLSSSVLVKGIDKFVKIRQEEDRLIDRISLLPLYLTDLDNILPTYRKPYLEMFSVQGDKKYNFKKEKGNQKQNRSNLQNDTIITSLIKPSLWDAAQWKGCGYLLARDGSEPGIMVFLYENITAGKAIFEDWAHAFERGELNLKITIITGVDLKHPQWYKVFISPDMKMVMKNKVESRERYIISSSRFHLMNAASDLNIKILKKLFERFGFIGISASAIENDQMSFDKDKRYNKVIPIRNIEFREAWTIGENEPESAAILSKDEVIIPMGHEKDAPVLKVKERKMGNE